MKTGSRDRGSRVRPRLGGATAIGNIAKARAKAQNVPYTLGTPVLPDGRPRAYVIDSLKHLAEVKLLRRLYGDAFVLIGVVCSLPVLQRRLANAMFTWVERGKPSNMDALRDFIRRDADDASSKHGLHVTDAFHEADFLVDNTPKVSIPRARHGYLRYACPQGPAMVAAP